MIGQLALPLAWDEGEDDGPYLVSEANRALIRHLEHWSLWPVMATILTGPRKSGRSLLGRTFARASGGEFADDAEVQDEEALFHAWNRAQSRRRPLILVADAPPPAWRPRLPDLRSRLNATPVLRIAEPDAWLAGQLIEKLCHRRGLAAPPELLRYLGPRIERSYWSVTRTVEALDELAYRHRQRLTVPLARRALIALGVIDVSREAE